MGLRQYVKRYVAEARERPAMAIAPTMLDELAREADREFDGAFAVQSAYVAPYTFLARDFLAQTNEESQGCEIEFGEPTEIVGCYVQIRNITPAGEDVQPVLLEDIDVKIGVDRHEVYTAREKRQVSDRFAFVSLAALDAKIANRLLAISLEPANPVLTVQFRWADEKAIRDALGLGDVRVDINFFTRTLSA